MSRRTMLAATAVAASAGLGGCRTDGAGPQPPDGDGGGTAVALPTYQESAVAQPDLPGSQDLMAAYLRYPVEPRASVAEPPLAPGTTISVFGTQAAPMVPMRTNQLWQAVAEDMGGAELEFIVAPSGSEQIQKLQTMMSGNDLTDVVQMATIARLPDALEAQFADLTDHLSGDAVLDYPNLAAIPTWAWQSSVYNDRLFTLPVVRGKLSSIPIVRADLLEKVGGASLETGEDLRELCRQLTAPSANQWAIGQDPATWVAVIAAMMGAPNQWAVDQTTGSFRHLWETDEFLAAIEQVRQMFVDDKVFHPDAASGPDPQAGFASGAMALQWASYAVWSFLLRTYPDAPPGSFRLPAWDGGGGAPHFVATAPFQFSAIAKAEPERVKEILRALDYWAAPLGSKEYTLRVFGTEGVHHTRENGEPVTTQGGQSQAASPVSTVIGGAPALHLPGEPDAAKELHALQGELVPEGVVDASVGLFSETRIVKGAAIDRDLTDELRGVVSGRGAVSQWQSAVDRWRSEGGDEIRTEYEQAHRAK